uniref:Uncharacterized protein n=1 Tax=Strigamia maritima TaxID=126957 RepID=T1IS42_STRMM
MADSDVTGHRCRCCKCENCKCDPCKCCKCCEHCPGHRRDDDGNFARQMRMLQMRRFADVILADAANAAKRVLATEPSLAANAKIANALKPKENAIVIKMSKFYIVFFLVLICFAVLIPQVNAGDIGDKILGLLCKFPIIKNIVNMIFKDFCKN